MDDFLFRAVLAGVGVALVAGPLGSFVVWRKMAYFSDATSHAAILGVALALAFGFPVWIATLFISFLVAVSLAVLAARGWAADMTLGVLAHSALAFGLIAISFVPGARTDLTAWLFGDILATSRADLLFVWSGTIIGLGVLLWRWNGLITATLNEDLAYASGINPKYERLALMLVLALIVAMGIKVVGALLIAAMLIIPAAAARQVSRTPESMAVMAGLIGTISVFGGVGGSLWYDIPTGPAIVAMSTLTLVLIAIIRFSMRSFFQVNFKKS